MPIFQYLDQTKIIPGAEINQASLAAADFKGYFSSTYRKPRDNNRKIFHSIGMTSFFQTEQFATIRHILRLPPSLFDMKILQQLVLMDELYSFSVVREPIDRMTSNFRWARSFSRTTQSFENMSFEEFVQDSFEQYDLNEQYLAGHINPQSHFVDRDVDWYKYEDGLAAALTCALEKVGLSLNGVISELPYENRSMGPRPQIGGGTRRLIEEFYAEDFELFGY